MTIECSRRLVDLCPASAKVHSELVVALLHAAGNDPDLMNSVHSTWAARHGRSAGERPKLMPGLPGRRLRIGYVGPCFRRYTAARFVKPVLSKHDLSRVEVFLYCDVPLADTDKTTHEFRLMGHAWRQIGGIPDDVVEPVIRADGLDILVDLAGHMDNPRLPLLARQLAPIQATYLAYPATTGLSTVAQLSPWSRLERT